MLEQLNKLCGTKHDIFYGARILRSRLAMDMREVDVSEAKEMGQLEVGKNSIVRSKILNHFIKGKISLSPMEIILAIIGELDSLKSLVKVIREKHDEGLKTSNLTKVERLHVIWIININKSHRNKMLHLFVEISNNLIGSLVEIGVSMSIMLVAIVWELGIMHLVFGSKSYKTASGVVAQVLGRINELLVWIGDFNA